MTNHRQLSSYCTLVCVAEMALSRKQLIHKGDSNRVTAFSDEKFACIWVIMKSVGGAVV